MSRARELALELGAKRGEVDGRKLSPMLCVQDDTGARVLGREGWTFELKLDGARIIADKRGSAVSLAYRKQRDATASYAEVADVLRGLEEERVVLDGEIVAFDAAGKPDFQLLARRIQSQRPRSDVPVVFVAFDVLAVGDLDVRALPLEARRRILALVVPDREGLVRLQPTFADGEALLRMCREHELEGVVAKRAGSTYRTGDRSPDWVKVKLERDADLVVVGWTEGEGRRSRLGALDLASYEGNRLVVRGAVGSGLDEPTIDLLLARLEELELPRPVAEGRYSSNRKRRHVRPEVVVSVRYMAFTSEGTLRFPVFRGLRADVRPEECTLSPRGDAPRAEEALAEHYERVANALLPHVKDRTSSLVRADGSPVWPLPRWTPPSVRKTDAKGIVIDDLDTLLFTVEAGAVTLLAASGSDRLAFRASSHDGARALRDLAAEIGLTAFAKAGTDRAIDVTIPLTAGAPPAVLGALAPLLAKLAGEDVAVATSLVPPWGILVAPGAQLRVSIPLGWDALETPAPLLSELTAEPEPAVARAMAEARGDALAAAGALEAVVLRRSKFGR